MNGAKRTVRHAVVAATVFIAVLTVGMPAVRAQEKPAPAPAPAPINVAGKWQMTIEMDMGTATPSVVFKQDGDKLTGTYTGNYGDYAVTGKVTGRTLSFSFAMGDDGSMLMSFTGEVAADGQSVKGTGDMGELGTPNWSATKVKTIEK